MADLGTKWEHEQIDGRRHIQRIWQRPIAYALANGAMRRIDSALADTGDAALPLGVDQLIQLRIAPRLSGNAPLVHFGHGGSHVRFTPLGTANVDGAVAGPSILFPEAWVNADLRLTNLGHGLRTETILRTGHPRSFAFRVDGSAGMDEATLTAPTWRIPPPYLTDGRFDSVPLPWATTRQGRKLILTATVPAGNWDGWTLDPSPLVLQPAAAAGKDTKIESLNPDTNYGTDVNLSMGSYSADVYRHLIGFDVSSIPATATCDSATLSLWGNGATAVTATRPLNYYRVLRAWTEAGATWHHYVGTSDWGTDGCSNTTTDREAGGVGSTTYLTTDGDGTQKDVALTAASVADWWNGGLTNNGLIGIGYESGQNAWNFRSSDHATSAQRPMLTVAYTEASTFIPRLTLMGVG